MAESVKWFEAGELGRGSQRIREGGGKVRGEKIRGGVCHAGEGGFQFNVAGNAVKAFAEFAAHLPFDETALPPVAEILFIDGAPAEGIAQDGLDFRQAVEPRGEDPTRDVAFKAAIDFVPKFGRQFGDFSSASHGAGGRVCFGLEIRR